MGPRGMLRRGICAALAGILVTGTIMISSLSAAQADSAKTANPLFGLRPALFGRTTLANGHFDYNLPAGATVVDAVNTVNFTPGPLNVQLYRANLNPVSGGGLAPGQAGDRPSGATAWIKLTQADLVLPPNGEGTDVFRLSIPRYTPPGDYLAAIVGSQTGRPSQQEGLTLQSRVALTVKVTVVGKLRVGLALGPIRTHRSGGTDLLGLDVVNTGNTLLTLRGAITIRDGGAPSAVELGPSALYVIPAGTAHLSGTWSSLPFAGSAHLEATVTALVNATPVGTYHSKTLDLWFIPWRDLTLLAAALLATAASIVLTRKRWTAWLARRAEERQMIKNYRAKRPNA